MTATPTPPRTDTTSLPAEGGFIGSGQEGGVVDQVRAYVQRVRHGDMGALPAIGGLVVLVILFAILSETTSDDVVGYITGSKTYDGASA